MNPTYDLVLKNVRSSVPAAPHRSTRTLAVRDGRIAALAPPIRVEEPAAPDSFRIAGSSELQLAMLVEMMRREGFELSVGTPSILVREVGGKAFEPVETLVLDCPQEFVATLTEARRSPPGPRALAAGR